MLSAHSKYSLVSIASLALLILVTAFAWVSSANADVQIGVRGNILTVRYPNEPALTRADMMYFTGIVEQNGRLVVTTSRLGAADGRLNGDGGYGTDVNSGCTDTYRTSELFGVGSSEASCDSSRVRYVQILGGPSRDRVSLRLPSRFGGHVETYGGDDFIAFCAGEQFGPNTPAVVAGAGNDEIEAFRGAGRDPSGCHPQGNNLSFSGGADNDTIVGSSGNDSLLGEDGNDRLTGGDGSDSLSGGEGDDALRDGDGVHDRGDGGVGNDTIDFRDSAGAYSFDLIHGGEGNETVLSRDGSTDRLYCEAGRDSVRSDSSIVDPTEANDCEEVSAWSVSDLSVNDIYTRDAPPSLGSELDSEKPGSEAEPTDSNKEKPAKDTSSK